VVRARTCDLQCVNFKEAVTSASTATLDHNEAQRFFRLIHFELAQKRDHFGDHIEKADKRRQSCWCRLSFKALYFLELRTDSLTISGGEI